MPTVFKPLVESLPGLADADLLVLHRTDPCAFPHLLESAAAGPNGRWDLLFCLPGEALVLGADGQLEGPHARADGDFLASLDDWFRAAAGPGTGEPGLPFVGGWFFYLGYELAAQIEPTLRLPSFAPHFPTALAHRCRGAVLRDRKTRRAWLVAEPGAEGLDALRARLAELPPPAPPSGLPPCRVTEDPPADYLAGVARVRDYVHAGDVFQANLSRAWQLDFEQPVTPVAVYDRLREANPAPFAALMNWAGSAVISSSPERLVAAADGWFETRPIAGTRRRGVDDAADRALIAELIGHPKERAEHIMLIDLERNDLGRVCRPGTVEVDELMTVESYAHVHHIVSNVRGRPRPGVGPGALLRAVFPGGTITGCPKVRCMEILAELEGTGRGPYTGSLGYLGRDGRMDSNILIRTILMEDDRRGLLRTGAGIVADSEPEHELDETRAKARGLLLALGVEGA
ncbi:MAG: aminodeoxychorismate synthase component I [Halothiobacillaceae bacterium]